MKGHIKNLSIFILFGGGLTHDAGMNKASNNSKIFHFLSIYMMRKFSILVLPDQSCLIKVTIFLHLNT